MGTLDERRAQALSRINKNARFEQQQDNIARQRLEALIEAERKQNKAAELQAIHDEGENKKFWFDDAAKGAKFGMAAGGPWGALAGATAGTIMGQHEAYKQRRKEGAGFFEAAAKTNFSTPFTGGGTKEAKLAALGDAAGTIGMAKERSDRAAAREEKATVKAEDHQMMLERIRALNSTDSSSSTAGTADSQRYADENWRVDNNRAAGNTYDTLFTDEELVARGGGTRPRGYRGY